MKYILLILMALLLNACEAEEVLSKSTSNAEYQDDARPTPEEQHRYDTSMQYIQWAMQYLPVDYSFNDYKQYCEHTNTERFFTESLYAVARMKCNTIISYEQKWIYNEGI